METLEELIMRYIEEFDRSPFVCVVVAMVAGTTISTVLTGLWNMITTIVRIISNA